MGPFPRGTRWPNDRMSVSQDNQGKRSALWLKPFAPVVERGAVGISRGDYAEFASPDDVMATATKNPQVLEEVREAMRERREGEARARARASTKEQERLATDTYATKLEEELREEEDAQARAAAEREAAARPRVTVVDEARAWLAARPAFHSATDHPGNGSAGGKGSRQNGSVTSGKGLALRTGHGGPSPEPVDCRWTALAAPAARAGHRVPAGGRTGNGSSGPSLGVEQSTQNCETTAKGTGLAESAGKEDPVELDSSPTL
ncbi:hypothetical protein Vadar_025629 [Vaccinium darrowii]|uniref:Uncharacterized protein n=1 Tax=Vaccinium darrowii TaxID=229202 RepID=A0ACB7XCF6_9ERIC|nr:hypothetical protein Vadar_025629 [Vaccinium darrowii]